MPDDVLELIASSIERNIRELEGALIRVTAFASLNKTPIDTALAEIVLRDLIADAGTMQISAAMIMAATAEYFDTTVEELRGPGKTRALAQSRQIAMYLCRELTDLSLPKIGQAFGRDHTTVMYAQKKILERDGVRAARSSITSRNSPPESASAPSADIRCQSRTGIHSGRKTLAPHVSAVTAGGCAHRVDNLGNDRRPRRGSPCTTREYSTAQPSLAAMSSTVDPQPSTALPSRASLLHPQSCTGPITVTDIYS